MNQRPQIPFSVDVAAHCYFEDCTHIKNYLSIYLSISGLEIISYLKKF